jgi:hypothetical protein
LTRWSDVLLVVLIAGALLLVCLPDAPARHFEQRTCQHHTGQGATAREKYIRCEARRIGTSPRIAVATAFCESGSDLLDRYAPYAGPFQQDVDSWSYRFHRWTGRNHPKDGELRNHPAAFRPNVLVSLRMARAFGWGDPHWPNCP